MREGRVAAPALALASIAAYIAHLVAQHTIDVVRARQLLPRWDLATHLGHGWLDYHLLASGQIHRLLWDVWLQGYWPPALSLYQVPFYAVLGNEITSGLWSSPAAFVLVVAAGAVILLKDSDRGGMLAASVFVSLLISSPFLLAYASVAMTEMLGAAGQLLVVWRYQAWRQRPDARHARLFAISLTALFFVKYNYFVLLVGPLVIYEWLDHTSHATLSRRVDYLRQYARRVVSSPTGLLVVLYLIAVLIITRTGGFRFDLLGQRISVRSIGSSGHIVLYVLLLRLWYLHRRGRIDWRRVTSVDARVRPLLLWFVLPVGLWLATPYPNHMRDVANLLINRPLGEPTVTSGIGTYLQTLRTEYFYAPWVLGTVVAAFVLAAVRYAQQTPVMQWLILAVPLQLAAIGLHQTRFPRFLLLTVVLLCLVAADEVGRRCRRSITARRAVFLLAAIVLALGVRAARSAVAEQRFRSIAFENYIDSPPLRDALSSIRSELTSDDRLLIVGQSNDLSPALFRWELGPPSGIACFPFPIAGVDRLHPALATDVLILAPLDDGNGQLDWVDVDQARLNAVMGDIEAGELALRREFALADLRVALRLYTRLSRPGSVVDCSLL